jgi:hypothetical protein
MTNFLFFNTTECPNLKINWLRDKMKNVFGTKGAFNDG